MHLPNRLTVLRVTAGLSQAQLAERLDVEPSTVSRWETRRTAIPDMRKTELAAIFGVTVSDLMDDWEPEPDGVAA